MPAPKPPEFRRRAVELARLRENPIAQIAKDLQISESCLRRWMDQADVDEGHQPGLSSDERQELVELRRKNRVLETEIEILKRASAYFARVNVLPKWVSAGPTRAQAPGRLRRWESVKVRLHRHGGKRPLRWAQTRWCQGCRISRATHLAPPGTLRPSRV